MLTLTVRGCVDLALANNEKIFQPSDIEAARASVKPFSDASQLATSLTFVHTGFNERNRGVRPLGGSGSGAGFINTGTATSILLNILGSVAQNYLTDRCQTQPGDDLRIETFTADRCCKGTDPPPSTPRGSSPSQEGEAVAARSATPNRASTTSRWSRPSRGGDRERRTFERNLTDAQQMFDVGPSAASVLRAKTG